MFCNSNYEYPRGTRPLVFFGNVLILRRLQSYPDRELMKIARKWGDSCLIWAARYPILMINKAQVATELLVDVSVTNLHSVQVVRTKSFIERPHKLLAAGTKQLPKQYLAMATALIALAHTFEVRPLQQR